MNGEAVEREGGGIDGHEDAPSEVAAGCAAGVRTAMGRPARATSTAPADASRASASGSGVPTPTSGSGSPARSATGAAGAAAFRTDSVTAPETSPSTGSRVDATGAAGTP